ncbi:antibiotic biosynthesis monooxygenase [Microdochium nivale]|nr:antibiotic biosynthesis monooxygenase [Microdochium nivale]
MTVSEIAHLTLSGDMSEAFIEASRTALKAQDEWCKAHHDPAFSAPASARGVAVFRQLEDPTKILITGHWASIDEHMAWVASSESQAALGPLVQFIDLSATDYFHVEDSELFNDTFIDSYDSVLRVSRAVVAQADKQSFEEMASPHLIADKAKAGWRIEVDLEQPDDAAQFVVVSQCGDQNGATKEPVFDAVKGLEGLVISSATKRYKRLC